MSKCFPHTLVQPRVGDIIVPIFTDEVLGGLKANCCGSSKGLHDLPKFTWLLCHRVGICTQIYLAEVRALPVKCHPSLPYRSENLKSTVSVRAFWQLWKALRCKEFLSLKSNLSRQARDEIVENCGSGKCSHLPSQWHSFPDHRQ